MDWRFEEGHPLLWDFAEQSTVFVNAPFDRGAFFDGLMTLALPNLCEGDLRSYIHLPDPSKAPMGLTMPVQLHEPVLTVFRRLSVPVFSPDSPRTPDPAVVFLIDDDDYIIADDSRSTCRSSSTNLSGFSLPREMAKRCERHEPDPCVGPANETQRNANGRLTILGLDARSWHRHEADRAPEGACL